MQDIKEGVVRGSQISIVISHSDTEMSHITKEG